MTTPQGPTGHKDSPNELGPEPPRDQMRSSSSMLLPKDYVGANYADYWKQRAELAERELEHFKSGGIIEVAIRNASVSEYMRHWEGRTERAENAELRENISRLRERLAVLEKPGV